MKRTRVLRVVAKGSVPCDANDLEAVGRLKRALDQVKELLPGLQITTWWGFERGDPLDHVNDAPMVGGKRPTDPEAPEPYQGA